jgi:hypothetical protein
VALLLCLDLAEIDVTSMLRQQQWICTKRNKNNDQEMGWLGGKCDFEGNLPGK